MISMAGKKESFRYWLTFDPETGKKPLLYQMVKEFDVEFNVRSADCWCSWRWSESGRAHWSHY